MMKKSELEKMYNELVDYNTQLENEVEEYRLRLVPKYKAGQKLYISNIKDKQVNSIIADEIVITRLGISYREYNKDGDFVQYPEHLCFASEREAQAKI